MAKRTKAADNLVPRQPNPARVYDYFLGGRDNFQVDRAVAQRASAEMPEIQEGARATRGAWPGGPLPGQGGRHQATG
ncbi:MAG TPA: SAM-dependent methyltransferase [Trebonia sp.]